MPAVVFDLDGTLIDSLPGIAGAANDTLAEFGKAPLSQATLGTFVGHGAEVFVDRLFAATDLRAPRADVLRAFYGHYERAGATTTLFPGVRDMLETLWACDVPVGLCTNKPSGPLDAVLDALALRGFFDAIVAGDSLPRRKPDPAPLHHAFRSLDAAPGVFVGDSDVDAETALRAGAPLVLFTEGIRHKPTSDLPHSVAFDDFAALPEILARFD
ncbi:MAG: phosphoglycolate phosphatase [Roseovarius sp.]|nr:phosphoglycolate phosphatase [Roseovarius sp.]